MTIFIYGRVSSSRQAGTDHASLDVQIEQSKAFARQNYPGVGQVIVSETISGRILSSQKKLGKILEKLKSGDVFIFYNVSRFSRDSANAIGMLAKLGREGVRIHSVFDKLNYPADRASFRRLLVEANEESDVISDRVRGALSYIRGQNGHIGTAPYGYKAERKTSVRGHTYCPRKLTSNPEEMEVVRKIIHYVDKITDLDSRVTKNYAICNVIAETFNTSNILCRGKPWTAERVKGIYKTFTESGSKKCGDADTDDGGIACQICKYTDFTSKNLIVLCDGCNKGYHIKCVKIPKVPEGQFFCSLMCQFTKM